MQTIARALVLACKHIDDRHHAGNDDDVAALEAIAAEGQVMNHSIRPKVFTDLAKHKPSRGA